MQFQQQQQQENDLIIIAIHRLFFFFYFPRKVCSVFKAAFCFDALLKLLALGRFISKSMIANPIRAKG